MSTTVFLEGNVTRVWNGKHPLRQSSESLISGYRDILDRQCLRREESLKFLRPLGSGGQGVVYLSERLGCDSFALPIAVKVFSPEHYDNEAMYYQAMSQLARVAAKVAVIQHDNLLDVQNWVSHNGIRLMAMEWVDGFDLSQLLRKNILTRLKKNVTEERFQYVREVIVTEGPVHPRLKPGVAIAIIRECLGALSALHRHGIIHGDIKPSNIMLKRTGHAKIVDIGSAFEQDQPAMQTCTPAYSAPEVLEGNIGTPQSDLASLGYVLIDMLSGAAMFDNAKDLQSLLEAKRNLHANLPDLLPKEVVSSELLMNICRTLIAPDPADRFPTAEAADLFKEGAADFHRQLIKGDLASEYDNEIRHWIEELRDRK